MKAPSRNLSRSAILLSLIACFLQASEIRAHGLRMPVDTSGVTVPALTHGQMATISGYRGEIDTLASWIAPRDAEVRKLLAFSRAQYARCVWGLMPRSIVDEASPFNECSHAYLAADRAMLMRMKGLPYFPQIAADLYDRVETAMILNQSSIVLCLYSASAFNTASLVNPDWHDLLLHRPTLLTLVGFFGICSIGLAAIVTLMARRPRLARTPSGKLV
jgi:hypothetical protein